MALHDHTGHFETSSRGLLWTGVTVVLAATALRLWGLDRSLWLDEFGTLWVVEEGLAEVVSRALSFQGQSPLYYLTAWPFLQILGESEVALRLPSLMFDAGAAYFVYRTALIVAGPRAGRIAASLYLLSATAVLAAAEARPYAAAFFFTAMAFYGFCLASMNGRWTGRGLFVLGGAGLVAAHYLLAPVLIGVALAFVFVPSLRARYTAGMFACDVLLQVLLSVPWIPHVMALWTRRSDLEFMVGNSYLGFLTLSLPLLLFAATAVSDHGVPSTNKMPGAFYVLGLGAILPLILLISLSLVGINLLASRYVSNTVVPFAALAGTLAGPFPFKNLRLSWGLWGGLTVLHLLIQVSGSGAFSGAGRQDWRGAVQKTETVVAAEPSTLVLYRSSFVESDLRAQGRLVPDTLMAPLRSPGAPTPTWSVVPLTMSWELSGRKHYFEEKVVPAIEGRKSFVYLSCRCATGPASASYDRRFQQWVEERFGSTYHAEKMEAGRGMVLVRFARTRKP